MTDIHCHILPGLDDGPCDAAEMAEMLRMAADAGTTHLAATPHANTRYRWDESTVDRLLDEARAAAPPGLTLCRGCDFHLMHDNLVDAWAHPRRYTLNGGRYLLVELSNMIVFPNTSEMFDRLEDAGMRVILTHPERNPILRQRPELIDEWVGQGRLMQVTASSLTGQWGTAAQSFARRMLDRAQVHVIASDGHNTETRPPRLDTARPWLERHYGKPTVRLLLEDNPRAIVEDRDVKPMEVLTRKPVADKDGLWRRLFGRRGTPSESPPEEPKT
jgi:protein-tyrosine phosphatase